MSMGREEKVPLRFASCPGKRGFFLIAGPCVIESRAHVFKMARYLKQITEGLDLSLVFKASFDKANRTSFDSFRGPGLDRGLEILQEVKQETGLPVLSDIHEAGQAEKAAEILDIIQIPAFLCRQTDLITAAARTGKPLNIKKGQFMAPWDMAAVVEKARKAGAGELLLTERGASFGYNNLVVDFRSIPVMQSLGCPVVFDATHSVQMPGGKGSSSAGTPEHIPVLARAAAAAGADGFFFEVHDHPERALSDGANSLDVGRLSDLLGTLIRIREAAF